MIKRKLLLSLIKHLPKKEFSIIIGPRQSGKTTLMGMLQDRLAQEGEKTLYLNLDVEWDRPYFGSQQALINKIELEFGKQKGFVFIDEIQRKENAGLFLKGLYDLNLPYKFIVSGSGSLELKEQIHESLIGRKRLFQLTTVTFEEFINYKTNYKYKDSLLSFVEIETHKVLQLLTEYMNFGGYPAVVIETEQKEKLRIIDEIYRSVLEKDVAYLLKVEKTEAFSSLVRILSSQIGSLVNFSELSSSLNISYQTLKKYLWYCRKIFILELVSPYFKNTRKEITKSPVVYFWDLGLRNYALGLFGNLYSPAAAGFVFENLVFLLISEQIRLSSAKLNFWRTKDKAEVDFIIERGPDIIPVEVKYSSFKDVKITRSMRSFIKKYEPPEAYIINLDLKKSINIGKTRLTFIPYYLFMFKALPRPEKGMNIEH